MTYLANTMFISGDVDPILLTLFVRYIGEQFCNVWRGWSKLKIITSLRQILANLKEKASQLSNCYNSIHCNFLFITN
jgi:hypothetical protein